MARAFGDFCLKDFGLICVPEVTYRQITEKDEFIVLATDGVMEIFALICLFGFQMSFK
jgi:serine/threonine protein phosphatase PrpC